MLDQIRSVFDNPNVLAGAVLIGSFVVAFIAEFIITRVLLAAAGKTKTDLDDKVIDYLRRPLFLSVILIGLGWSVARIEPGLNTTALRIVVASLKTIAILIWTTAGFRVTSVLLKAMSERASRRGNASIVQQSTVPIFDMLLKVLLVGAALYCAFLTWNIDLTAWLASAGVIGIAVGFAAQDTLSNLFAGIFIVTEAPYKIGDFVVLGDDLRGKVTSIGIRSTRILTPQDIEIVIPNAMMGNNKIVNETGGPSKRQRISIETSVSYDSDIDRVREVLLGCPADVADVCTRPVPQVRFLKMADSGLEFELQVWIKDPAKRERVIDALNSKVFKALGAANIEIPYPKQDIYVREMAPAQAAPTAPAK